MGRIYFTRHGQTVWNVENKICGATDIALTDEGHRQAVEAGRYIKSAGLHIDEILYSPLIRASETARHISEITGIPMRMEPRLKEQCFGRFEAAPRDSKEFLESKSHFLDRYGDGESMVQLCHRVYNLLDEIRTEADRKTYLLIAHNGIARAVHSYFNEMGNEEFARFGIKNCEIRCYEY